MADDLATQVVDSLSRNFKGTHDHRAAHGKGFCVSGLFTATPEAAGLTRAAHLRGHPVAGTVRLPNGSGSRAPAAPHPRARDRAAPAQPPATHTTKQEQTPLPTRI